MKRFVRMVALILVGVALAQFPASSQGNAQSSINLDVRNVDLYTVVRMLAQASGRNIVIDNTSVKHDRITLKIQNVDFDTALRTVEMADGLQDARIGDIIYIGTADTMLRRYANNTAGDIYTEAFRLKNASVADLTSALIAALPPSTVIVPDNRTHSFVITASQETLDRARAVIAQLDIPLTGASAQGGIMTKTFHLRYIPSVCDQSSSSGLDGGLSGAFGGSSSGTGTSGGGSSCSGDALSTLKSAVTIAPPNSIVASSQNDSIIATGSADFINSLAPIINSLDQPGQQVLYEVRVVDLQPINDSENFGVQLGGYDLSGDPLVGATTTTFLNHTLKINATLNAMISSGHGETLATPRIAVLNNHEGDLLVGETYPISLVNAQTNGQQVQFINIGVLLSLTPIIGDDGDITTDLHPEFSSILGQNAEGIPIISNRRIDTVLRVKSGESIVIAGLVQDILVNTTTKIPFLSNMPVFGGLFQNKNESHTHDEIVFVITPHIVTSADIIHESVPNSSPSTLPGMTVPANNSDQAKPTLRGNTIPASTTTGTNHSEM